MTTTAWTANATAISLLLLFAGHAHADDAAQNAGLGARVFAENCSRCNESPDPASRSSQEWRAISVHMRVIAEISLADQRNVLIFLRTYNTISMTRTPGSAVTH